MKKKQPKKTKVNAIVSRYLMHTSFDKFRFITVYQDYSLTLGSEQKLSELTSPIPMFVGKTTT